MSPEEFGVCRKLTIAQATDTRILDVGQDGALVTALLIYALETKLIDGAVVSGVKDGKPCFPNPLLATTASEIMNCSGTRYFYSPNVLALKEAVRQKKTSLAFVGTPCQIQVVRKAQKAGLRFVSPVKYLIGLMCSECFSYEGLMENHLHKMLGLNLDSIRRMNIKGKMLITTSSGLHTVPLAAVKQYARESCRQCSDFSSELADVSAGGLGLNRWTFVVVRTEKGAELFDGAERVGVIKTRDVKEEPSALNLLCSLSKKKRGPIF
jgi:coenzyme F420 hydrogenase subunit beta